MLKICFGPLHSLYFWFYHTLSLPHCMQLSTFWHAFLSPQCTLPFKQITVFWQWCGKVSNITAWQNFVEEIINGQSWQLHVHLVEVLSYCWACTEGNGPIQVAEPRQHLMPVLSQGWWLLDSRDSFEKIWNLGKQASKLVWIFFGTSTLSAAA